MDKSATEIIFAWDGDVISSESQKTKPYFTHSSRNRKFTKASGTIFKEKYFQIVSICVSIYNGLCNILNQIQHHMTTYLLEALNNDLGQSLKTIIKKFLKEICSFILQFC